MSTEITASKREPYPRGLFRNGETLHFSAAFHASGQNGICLLSCKKTLIILLNDSFCTGRIYSAVLENVPAEFDSYFLYENGVLRTDSYARQLIPVDLNSLPSPEVLRFDTSVSNHYSLMKGSTVEKEHCLQAFQFSHAQKPLYAAVIATSLSQDTRPAGRRPHLPYASSFFYCLNVRGYTMQDQSISKKAERGTFKGLEQKIPYLKELGVTAVELMPIFEPDLCIPEKDLSPVAFSPALNEDRQDTITARPNLWGFQEGFYFAVRADYATDKGHPGAEFSRMVDAFHAAGMEVILQFWFSQNCEKNLIMDCLRFYVSAYQIDGIHLKSDNISEDLILSDPLFSDIKILSKNRSHLSFGAGEHQFLPAYYGEDFMWRARHFLKGDDLSILPFVESAFTGQSGVPEIHYICNYDGFTLRDLVTYEHKRNEDNGEHSEDGRNDNVSWNCGIEGDTRKKQIVTLRNKQMLNALSFVFLSLGTPLLFAGDEAGNTQNGNNNPYCQDNPVGWTDYDAKGKYSFVTNYVRFLSKLRAGLTDRSIAKDSSRTSSSKLIPDLSFHGIEAWKPDYGHTSHSIGIMIVTAEEERIFIAFNMYWEDILFALPGSSSDGQWYALSDTSRDNPVYEEPIPVPAGKLEVKARSVVICKNKPTEHGLVMTDQKKISKKPNTSRNKKQSN